MSDLKCLENIVGLSETTCPCFDEGKPNDADVSKSGYFVDKLPGLDIKLIGADVECGDDSIWSKMESALDTATNIFRTDVLASITEFATSRRKPFNGLIGEKRKRNVINAQNNFMGVTIQGCDIKGAEFTLKAINTYMDASAAFDVYVWNNIEDVPLLQIPGVLSVANTIKENLLTPSPDLTFPLYSTECDDLEYYIVYAPVGFNPFDNKVSCGCSRKQVWEHWFDVQGITGDDMADRETFPRNEFANGLILDLIIHCNTQDLICGGDNVDMDYENDSIARVIAASIQFKTGVVLTEDILNSGNLNRYTMMSRDYMKGRRSHYSAEYGSRIQWLGENIQISGNDCLACDDSRMSRVDLLS